MKIQKLLLFCTLILFSTSFSAKTAPKWEPELLFGDSFYPSFALANSTYKSIYEELQLNPSADDLHGQIGVEVMPSTQNYLLKVKIVCDEIMFPTEASMNVTQKNKSFHFYPKIDYKWNELRKISQTRPVTIKITTWINGKLQDTKMKIVTLQSINNCPYTCVSKENKIVDLNYMYAAYVNEDHPMINDVLLKEIFSQGAIKQVTAYQTGNPLDVVKQVFAVWNMLQKRGISYSSLSASGNNDKNFLPIVYHQYVRTFDDAISGQQANCVDGTVLMASILYRMGIDPFIVTTPYHCFLGYSLGNNLNFYLETTMLGSEPSAENITAAKTFEYYDTVLGAKFGKAYDSFIVATAVGNMTYEKDSDKFNNYSTIARLSFVSNDNRDELVRNLQYQIYPVKKYKDRGIQAIFK